MASWFPAEDHNGTDKNIIFKTDEAALMRTFFPLRLQRTLLTSKNKLTSPTEFFKDLTSSSYQEGNKTNHRYDTFRLQRDCSTKHFAALHLQNAILTNKRKPYE